MDTPPHYFPEDLYPNQLSVIRDIPFTHREVDVMACLLRGKTASKRMAYFLSVDPRTIDTYIRNITLKIERNTREEIIDFLETSDKIPLLRQHYNYLKIESTFAKCLKDISKKLLEKKPIIILSDNEEEGTFQFSLYTVLRDHLKLAGLQESHEDIQLDSYVIYALPSDFQTIPSPFMLSLNQCPKDKALLLLAPAQEKQTLPRELKGFKTLSAEKYNNYYFYVLEILKIVFPNCKIDSIVSNFQEKYKQIHNQHADYQLHSFKQTTEEVRPFLQYIKHVATSQKSFFPLSSTGMLRKSILATLIFTLIGFGIYILKKPHYELVARSDLSIPKDSILLNRTNLLSEIHNKLGAQAGIQNIALIGVGGAGKTTLARQYARSQETPIVWEINADSHTSLIHSFERLADFLSPNPEEKKFLRGLQSVENSDEKEEKIILLVREKLRAAPAWVLIFDNVHDFADIQNYFPQDSDIWGKGKIIITTRNLNIQYNSNINDVVHVINLNQTEKKTLFLKIFDKSGKIQQNSKELETFLTEIPSFPLDVSIAAHYIKATNTPYLTYLKRLDDYQENFDATQEKILKEEGNYAKTRFGIISLSLKEIVESHKDFENLLVFVSLVNSQCIPKNLLNKYKSDVVVDDFIYHLKKYSLFVRHPSELKDSSATFSIHRDTQKAILASLVKKMGVKKSSQIENISKTMEQYLVDLVDRENFLEMKKIPSHYEGFLSHSELFSPEAMSLITAELAHLYAHFGEYKRAKEMLQKGLRSPHQKTKIGYLAEIRLLKYLGNVERVLGNYDSARKFLERSHDLCVQNLPDNFNEIGWILSHLAHVNWFEGNYTQAKDLFEKTLLIYQQHSPNNLNGTAWVLGRLANTYRNLGNYKKAKNLLEESLALYQKFAPQNDIRMAQVLVYLGIVERKLRNYDAAKNRLEAALEIYKKHFLESHPDVGWAMVHLGHVESHLGNYTKAKELIDRGLRTYNANLPKQHIRIARALVHLGFAERGLGNYEKGHQLMQKGLAIIKEHYPKNIELPRFLAHTGLSAGDVGDKATARKLVTESLQIYKDRFSENHLEVGWALFMLASIELKSGNYETSKKLLEETLKIYRNNLEKDSLEHVRLLKYLGDINIALGNFDLATDYLDQSLKPYEAKNHSSRFLVLESLAELNIKKASVNKNNQDLSETLKLTAKEYLNQAIGVLNAHFPKDSPHVQRIQGKLLKLEQS